MELLLNIQIKKPPGFITYKDQILLVGSCFTEHIGNSLAGLKFNTLQNPNGILFDPISVCNSLLGYIDNRHYDRTNLFQLNEVWQTWQHHSRFSAREVNECLERINHSQSQAHTFLKQASWIIITFGSSFSYQLTNEGARNSLAPVTLPVTNCHRAPAQWFNKTLLKTSTIIDALEESYSKLLEFNPNLNIVYTISPVRHIRDGVVENNRSKARLIEAVHHMIENNERAHYFPAYELLIDVLRDYRFYDIDLVHPNYMATEYVLEKFTESFINPETQVLMKEIQKIVIARKHKAFQPDTTAHRQFLTSYYEKAKSISAKYPFINMDEEMQFFSQNGITR